MKKRVAGLAPLGMNYKNSFWNNSKESIKFWIFGRRGGLGSSQAAMSVQSKVKYYNYYNP